MDKMFYLNCLFMGTIGWLISALMIIKSQTTKFKKANLIYSPSAYFKEDWMTIGITYAVIAACMIAMYYIPEKAFVSDWANLVILSLFITIGYNANDMASRFFSVVNKRFNAAIDYKTNIADEQAGTLGTPTPADLPKP